jgi:hypothetical protein
MNTRQARVIDPIVTAVARGYRPVGALLATLFFPLVNVDARGGKIIVFGADDFKLVNSARAPGANTKRIEFGYGADDYALVDHSLEAKVPTEIQQEGLAVPGINNITIAVRRVQNLMALEREHQAATLARNAASYGANVFNADAVNERWTDPDSDPIAQVLDAKETIRKKIGVRPNSLGLAPTALTALRNHPKILDRLSTSTDRSPATLEQLRKLFEVENIQEGEAVHHNGVEFVDVWGNDAVLAYTTPATMQDQGSPNYGYTYQLEGHPFVEPGYGDRNTKSFIYPVTDARKPVLVGATAGFLFQNVGAAPI